MSEFYRCKICKKNLSSKKSLYNHERQIHPNNKIVPHCYIMGISSQEDFERYRNAFICKLKKNLPFNMKSTGQKTINIETFPERLFVNLFCGESTFHYKSYANEYSCSFKGIDGCKRIGEIFDKIDWYERKHSDPNLLTTSYVLMQEQNKSYEISFR